MRKGAGRPLPHQCTHAWAERGKENWNIRGRVVEPNRLALAAGRGSVPPSFVLDLIAAKSHATDLQGFSQAGERCRVIGAMQSFHDLRHGAEAQHETATRQRIQDNAVIAVMVGTRAEICMIPVPSLIRSVLPAR